MQEIFFSSSLHGIILAQAYGIPAQWIQIEGQPIQKDNHHKFEDYFLGSGQIIQVPIKVSLQESILNSLSSFRSRPKVLPFNNTNQLLDSFPFDAIQC